MTDWRSLYPLIVTAAVAVVCGHIASAHLVLEPGLHVPPAEARPGKRTWPADRPEPMPTFSSNDRSRWATVRALVDHGTYEIGFRDPSVPGSPNQYGDHGIVTEDGWRTIDVVLHPKTNRFYSSKPPLLSTLVAGEYWLLKTLFGWSLTDPITRWYVVRTVLWTVNAVPLLIYLFVLAHLAEQLGVTAWGRLFVLVAAGFGTFVTTFCITLNNHTVAACSALFAVAPVLATLGGATPRAWQLLVAGFFAGLTACCELPALALLVGLLALLLWRAPGRTLLLFVPAAVVPIAALLLTNYLALGEFVPAYSKFDSPWYRYEGSHWNRPPEQQTGIDWAAKKESRMIYALHLLFGHHGLFLLSPIYLLSIAGMLMGKRRESAGAEGMAAASAAHGPLALLTMYLTVVVVGFYAAVVSTANYGGWTNGPRWLIWLIPFWLLMLLPVADWLGKRRWGRALALALLGVSVFSASYTPWNPWRHPWMYNLLEAHGWIDY